ncbi:MAG: hypothetical protein A2648_02970 [Candidatus Lloydbacteria bacterium RIFCSPHIGHO2_01_FULL_41_20]|uniref:Uncharacterized protein n=1 Tax=Candidatus Lloydbacteria bacterium RIFCSPHIGHO2_01_FULL_41_20 TaxID=1798657 RepID=A0A1G2CS92_9BACT|nr:MAG: hypothetical protein A2648_02970 [Candidatus Lloydbacteria bacterium RIFCSPHIGHO2_01_FULL_41_20]
MPTTSVDAYLVATPATLNEFLGRVSQHILNPLIGFVFALALLYFVWGVVNFVRDSDDPTEREKGKQNMIWGIVGMFIMVAVYGITTLIIGTFGLNVTIPKG